VAPAVTLGGLANPAVLCASDLPRCMADLHDHVLRSRYVAVVNCPAREAAAAKPAPGLCRRRRAVRAARGGSSLLDEPYFDTCLLQGVAEGVPAVGTPATVYPAPVHPARRCRLDAPRVTYGDLRGPRCHDERGGQSGRPVLGELDDPAVAGLSSALGGLQLAPPSRAALGGPPGPCPHGGSLGR
jgi:hypothetical protein